MIYILETFTINFALAHGTIFDSSGLSIILLIKESGINNRPHIFGQIKNIVLLVMINIFILDKVITFHNHSHRFCVFRVKEIANHY